MSEKISIVMSLQSQMTHHKKQINEETKKLIDCKAKIEDIIQELEAEDKEVAEALRILLEDTKWII